MIVNVHFELELTLRQLRERLRLISPHCPSYPNAVDIILGHFNICEPEEGRFNVWNQTFTRQHSFICPHVLEIALPDYTRRDSTDLGIVRTSSRIARIFINLLIAEVRYFHCYSHVFENLGNWTIPSDHAAVRLVIQKPTIRGHQSKHIPSRLSKHPVFFALFWNGFTMTTDFLPIRLVHLQNSKFFLKGLRSWRSVNSHGRHRTASGRCCLSLVLPWVLQE